MLFARGQDVGLEPGIMLTAGMTVAYKKPVLLDSSYVIEVECSAAAAAGVVSADAVGADLSRDSSLPSAAVKKRKKRKTRYNVTATMWHAAAVNADTEAPNHRDGPGWAFQSTAGGGGGDPCAVATATFVSTGIPWAGQPAASAASQRASL